MFGFSSYQEFFYQTAIKKNNSHITPSPFKIFPVIPPNIPLLGQNLRAAQLTTAHTDLCGSSQSGATWPTLATHDSLLLHGQIALFLFFFRF
jgi:hypothetical protein